MTKWFGFRVVEQSKHPDLFWGVQTISGDTVWSRTRDCRLDALCQAALGVKSLLLPESCTTAAQHLSQSCLPPQVARAEVAVLAGVGSTLHNGAWSLSSPQSVARISPLAVYFGEGGVGSGSPDQLRYGSTARKPALGFLLQHHLRPG